MLSTTEYRSLDAVGLACLVRSKQVSALEVLECALKEVDRLNPILNAIVMRNDAQARLDAAVVDATLPLSGVPFAAKDINVQINGFQTTHACRYFADAPESTTDSLLVRRWRDAGLIIPVRTNTPEFATDFGCEPEFYGPTNNPWDLTLTPGGSSGGAAAAVASGMFPLAHASDSGGSIRAPAACCGVFGYKPTNGLVATGSALGSLVGGLNCDHAVSRTVRDSAMLLNVTAGPEVGNPLWFGELIDFIEHLDVPPPPLRIGFTTLSPTGLNANREICAQLDNTVRLLESLGHNVSPWQWPDNADACDVASVFWMAEIAVLIEQYAEVVGRPPDAHELGPVITAALQRSKKSGAIELVNAKVKLRELQVSMATATQNIDVLLTPMLTEPPLPTGLLSELVKKDVDQWMERAWRFSPYPEIFNVTGQPAMSVPLGSDEKGLPIGMHFAAAVGNDAVLLRLARQLELAQPWKDRYPPLAD